MTRRAVPPQVLAHAVVFALVVAFDQITKLWARTRFSLPGGEPDYGDFIAVIGDWLHFRLVYNYGAAFGMEPQRLLPFLHPVAFFVLLSGAAIALFGLYYRKLGREHGWERLGIVFVLAGAVGNNLIDRPIFHKVTDFIDVGIPGVHPRFPVFNIADISVCVGIGLLIVVSLFAGENRPAASAPPSSPENDHAR